MKTIFDASADIVLPKGIAATVHVVLWDADGKKIRLVRKRDIEPSAEVVFGRRGGYGSPGGGVRRDETVLQAGVREVREEVNLLDPDTYVINPVPIMVRGPSKKRKIGSKPNREEKHYDIFLFGKLAHDTRLPDDAVVNDPDRDIVSSCWIDREQIPQVKGRPRAWRGNFQFKDSFIIPAHVEAMFQSMSLLI